MAAKKKSAMPSGLKNSAKNRAAVARDAKKLGVKEKKPGTVSSRTGKKLAGNTPKQKAARKAAEGRARTRAGKADAKVNKANAKARATGKSIGPKASTKMVRGQAKARRLAKTGSGRGH